MLGILVCSSVPGTQETLSKLMNGVEILLPRISTINQALLFFFSFLMGCVKDWWGSGPISTFRSKAEVYSLLNFPLSLGWCGAPCESSIDSWLKCLWFTDSMIFLKTSAGTDPPLFPICIIGYELHCQYKINGITVCIGL